MGYTPVGLNDNRYPTTSVGTGNGGGGSSVKAPVYLWEGPESGASAQELEAGKSETQDTLRQAGNDQRSYSARITSTNGELSRLTTQSTDLDGEISQLTTDIGTLNDTISGYNTDLSTTNTNIKNLKAQILTIEDIESSVKESKGFFDAIGNFFDAIGNKATLVAELASEKIKQVQIENKIKTSQNELRAKIQERQDKQDEKEGIDNEIEGKEGILDSLRDGLKKIQDAIKAGNATLADYVEAVKNAANENGVEITDEAATQAAMTLMSGDAAKREGLVSQDGPDADKITDSVASYIASGAKPKGEANGDDKDKGNSGGNGGAAGDDDGYDESFLVDAQMAMGFTQDAAVNNVVMMGMIANYQEFGLNFDVNAFRQMTVGQMDMVIEQAMIKDMLKTTSPKILGDASMFTTKSDVDANSQAVNDFLDSYNSLNGYYTANDITDVEAQSFLTLHSRTVSDLSQGAVYDTNKLGGYTSEATRLLTSVEAKAKGGDGTTGGGETSFGDLSYKVQGALTGAENGMFGDMDDDQMTAYQSRYEWLVSEYNNGETDTDRLAAEAGLQILYDDIVNDSNEDNDPYNNREDRSFMAV